MPTDGHFRAWPRRRSDAPVVLRFGGAERRARMTDIGLGGAGVVLEPIPTGDPPAVGVAVDIVLSTPTRWEPLVLPARVAWTKGRRAGLAFHPVRDRDTYDLFEMLGAQIFDS